jgi:hypothetical protein
MSPNTIKIGTMQLSAAIETALLARFLGQIRLDFLQQLVAVGPPDGSGTKSLRSYFSHLEIESKTRGANSPGVNIYLPGLITEAEGQHAFPSVSAQKTASCSLSFRSQSHSRDRSR